MTPSEANAIIEKYLATIDSAKHHVEIAFFGGSFTAIDADSQNRLLDVALHYKKQGSVHGIRISTRPDCISLDILKNLEQKGVTVIELGVQSMCDDVLQSNNRGHTSADVTDAAGLIRRYNFSLGLQMMVGLIGDTKQKDIETAKKIAGLAPDFVRIYPALVFKNTKMYNDYIKGDYTPLTLDEAVDICADLLCIFRRHSIKVIRLGLLLDGDDAKTNFVAGPHHPRFSELVRKRCV